MGNEASGTSNMKFAMNGCLILAARGGSNDELRQEIGGDNMVEFLSNSFHLSCMTIFLSYKLL